MSHDALAQIINGYGIAFVIHREINYLHFLSFLDTEVAKVVLPPQYQEMIKCK